MSFDLWKKVRLGEIADIVMGQSPESKYYNNTGQGLPFLQGNRTFGYKYPTFDTYCTNGKKFAKPNDVLLSVRAPVGDLNISKAHICIGRGLASLCMKNGNTEYLFYLLRANIEELISQESGTVYGSINRNDINNFNVLVIDSDEKQREISHILSTLDDKIELNRQTNATLEAIAQAIFKEWFVDFNYPGATGEMIESELGLIPKRWKVGNLGDVGEFKNGINYSRDETGDHAYSIVNVRNIVGNRFIFYSDLDKVDINAKKAAPYKLSVQDIIIARSASPGVAAILYEPTDDTIFSGFTIRYRIHLNEHVMFLFLLFQTMKEKLANLANGTTLKSINQVSLKSVQIVIPEKETLEEFSAIVRAIYDKFFQNQQESELLRHIRDLLLPELMSNGLKLR